MKKIIFSLFLVFLSVMSFSQAGLDGIIVEKYYVANAADHAKDNTLPVGAVTYRIYVDMTPGWILQAINGSPSFNQRLQFKTTTSFFNETVSGDADAFGQNIKYTSLKNGLLMLDSWISLGAAAKTAVANIYYGVPKADDNTVGQIVNTDPTVLQNTSGYPAPYVKDRDGILMVATPPLAAIGQSPTLTPLITMLNGGPANDFTTTDATWFTSDNCTGPDPSTNKVLIGQFTTDGLFTFRINIQIKNPTTSVVEKYVNENPGTGQFLRTDLAQTLGLPASPPSVSILSVLPLPNTYTEGAVVTILANATDNISVSKVEFFAGSTPIGLGTLTATPGNYQLIWTSTPTTGPLTAVATDDEGTPTTSAPPVPITVASLASYLVTKQDVSCNSSDLFYIPVRTTPTYTVANVIGFDLDMSYDPAIVRPTGVIRVNGDLISPSLPAVTSYAVRIGTNSIKISLFFNGTAPAGLFFHGQGQVLEVEFAKTVAFQPAQIALFDVTGFTESYNTKTEIKSVTSGEFKTHKDTDFFGYLKFWADNSPINYTQPVAGKETSLITKIYGNTGGPANFVTPNATEGKFTYNITNGLNITLNRDISPDTSVQAAINGYDAYLTQKVVLLQDASFTPNVFQIMAMDVNRDQKVSAGDVSQILQRATKILPEFKQKWNYSDAGVPSGPPSADWYFIDNRALYGDPENGTQGYASFRKSTTFPQDDGVGYSKNKVPVYPLNNLPIPVVNSTTCPIIYTEVYQGIMIGDINGNYKDILPGERPGLRSLSVEEAVATANATASDASNKVTFDLSKATVADGFLTFPISVSSKSDINALDFSMRFDDSKLRFETVYSLTSKMESVANYDETDMTLRFSSYSMVSFSKEAPVVSVRFEVKEGATIANEDLKSIRAYVNGDPATVELSKLVLNKEIPGRVSVYPIPATGIINVEVADNADIQIIDMRGRVVLIESNVGAYQKRQINISGLGQGFYFMKINSKIGNEVTVVTTKKIVVTK